MASNDETIRLILELTGSKDIDEATAALNRMATATENVGSTHKVLQTVSTDTAKAHQALSRGVLDVSYAFQDFTSVIQSGGGFARAMGSIQNNIPGVIEKLGAGPGMAGAISLISVALGAAIPLMYKLFDAMDPDKAKQVADELKKIADEAERLKNLKPSAVEEPIKYAQAYLKEAGEAQIAGGITASLTAQGFGVSPEDKATLDLIAGKRARGEFVEPFYLGEEAKIQAKQAAAVGKRGAELLTTLPTSPQARGEVGAMARARPGLFPKEFAQGLQDIDPVAIEAAKKADQDLDEEDASRKAAKERRFERAREFNAKRKRVDALDKKRTDEGVRDLDAEERERDQTEKDVQDATNAANARQKHEAKAAAEKAARAADPTNQLRAKQDQQRDAVAREMMRIDAENQRQGGMPASPAFLQEATNQAIQNMDAGVMIGAAFQNAMFRANEKIQKDAADNINGWNPTLLNR